MPPALPTRPTVVRTARRRAATTGAAIAAAIALSGTSCSARRSPTPATHRSDVPEPAVAPPLKTTPAGRLVPIGGEPEGMAADRVTGILAVALRHPDGVALVTLASGSVQHVVSLDGAPRHLQLAGPGGPVIAPAEGSDTLYQLALPDGTISGRTHVGRQPHDAAPASGGRILVGNELADTVSVIQGTTEVAVVPGPLQPGGVAASDDGSVVAVVGVRGRQVESFGPDGRVLGRTPCGVGPTHIRGGSGRRFYVADTQGNAVLVFQADGQGRLRQVGRVDTGGTPYGLAIDMARRVLYVTLTATNQLRSFRIDGDRLVAARTWPTPRQPNDVIVNDSTGAVVVAGTAEGVLQFIDP